MDPLIGNIVTLSLSYGLSILATIYFLFNHSGSHYQTPFTGVLIITVIYWFITLSSQGVFLVKIIKESKNSNSQSNVLAVVGPHFIINNLLHFFWVYFFTRERFLISELLLIINVLNLLALYFTHKTIEIKSIGDWLTIHWPVTGWPLSWTLYALFWNGATLFHSHNKHLLPRLLANLAIWEFLLVPLALLILYGDWAVGLSTSLLMLSVGLGQLFTKLIAFQWGFAFTIAAADFAFSLLVMFSSAIQTNSTSNTLNVSADTNANAAATQPLIAS